MKKTDIVILAVCSLVIAGAVFFIVKNYLPKSATKSVQTKETMNFNGNIDQNTINQIEQRKNYGAPPMDNIGRDNPFGGL